MKGGAGRSPVWKDRMNSSPLNLRIGSTNWLGSDHRSVRVRGSGTSAIGDLEGTAVECDSRLQAFETHGVRTEATDRAEGRPTRSSRTGGGCADSLGTRDRARIDARAEVGPAHRIGVGSARQVEPRTWFNPSSPRIAWAV